MLLLIHSVLCEFLCFLWCSNIYRVWWFMVQASAEGKSCCSLPESNLIQTFLHTCVHQAIRKPARASGPWDDAMFSPDQSHDIIINHKSNLINSNFLSSLLWNWKDRTKDRTRTFSQALRRNSHLELRCYFRLLQWFKIPFRLFIFLLLPSERVVVHSTQLCCLYALCQCDWVTLHC